MSHLLRRRRRVTISRPSLRSCALNCARSSFSINSLAARPPAHSEEQSNRNGASEGLENDPELYHSPFYEAYQELTLAGLPAEYAHTAIPRRDPQRLAR
ncbi:MAG: hypothetical protein WKF84_28665 [Pyrinomonadaceae bacterium]